MIISIRPRTAMLAVALIFSMALPAASHAQGTEQGNGAQQAPPPAPAPAPKVDAKEEAAYKAFFDTSAQDSDKKIQLGQDFVQTYPNSHYLESVYGGLSQAYYVKEDWKNLFVVSDKALAINPDDVDLLAMVGWVIPHITNSNTPDADKQLDKAEAYEKRAITDLATLPKPAGMTDEQFATVKAEKVAEAHSGLGLVYFRRQDFDDAAKELQQATQGIPNPDATDFFALGASLQNSGHYTEAADAYTRCSQIMGSLQDACKQNADKAKQLATQKK